MCEGQSVASEAGDVAADRVADGVQATELSQGERIQGPIASALAQRRRRPALVGRGANYLDRHPTLGPFPDLRARERVTGEPAYASGQGVSGSQAIPRAGSRADFSLIRRRPAVR